MIRSLYRTDILSFLSFLRQAPPNQAAARNSLSKRSFLSPDVILEHYLPLKGKRDTWISKEGGRISGAISVKGSVTSTAWQIHYLQAADENRCVDLLDTASTAAAERGVRKLFLRLDEASPLIEGARRAGFAAYSKDYLYLYRGKGRSAGEVPEPYSIRARQPGDEHGLFTLYNATVPMQVRTAEGMTLEEWRESREPGSWLEHRKEFVLHKQDTLAGWLKITMSRGSGCFEIVAGQPTDDVLAWLVDYSIAQLSSKAPVLCLVPSFQAQLKGLLESSDFEQVAEYLTWVKEIAIKVKAPQFIPMRA